MPYLRIAGFDWSLAALLVGALIAHYTRIIPEPFDAGLIISVAVLGTIPVVISAIRAAFAREVNMDLLASVALVFSLLSSQWASAAFIALMLAAARILETLTRHQTERSVRSLLRLRPEEAKVVRNGQLETVPVEALIVGDIIAVNLGDRVPVDGSIIEGSLALDESSLTGESLPVEKPLGASVYSSTLVVSGGARVRVEKVGKDTTLEKIVALVESSGKQKPRFETLGARFGKFYLAGIFLVSFAILFITHDVLLVLSVVLVVCADDVAVAVPLAYLSSTGAAAQRGVIIKGSGYLEALASIDTLLLDKTGTLTTGILAVADIVATGNRSTQDLLALAGALTASSQHPVARALRTHAANEGVALSDARDVEEIGGMGMTGSCAGSSLMFGRPVFMEAHGIPIPSEVAVQTKKSEELGRSISYIAVDGAIAGFFALADQIRPEAVGAIADLRTLGVTRIVMLTGDNETVAHTVARAVGITEVRAHLLPEDKVSYVKDCLTEGGTVAVVGDGVNDAAALRMATVGIAMGAMGYDAAIESADIVLMSDDIAKIAYVIRLARFTGGISVGDFWIWGITNVLGLALVFTGVIGPTGAAAYNFVTDFFPLFNSLRTRSGVRTDARRSESRITSR